MNSPVNIFYVMDNIYDKATRNLQVTGAAVLRVYIFFAIRHDKQLSKHQFSEFRHFTAMPWW